MLGLPLSFGSDIFFGTILFEDLISCLINLAFEMQPSEKGNFWAVYYRWPVSVLSISTATFYILLISDYK